MVVVWRDCSVRICLVRRFHVIAGIVRSGHSLVAVSGMFGMCFVSKPDRCEEVAVTLLVIWNKGSKIKC